MPLLTFLLYSTFEPFLLIFGFEAKLSFWSNQMVWPDTTRLFIWKVEQTVVFGDCSCYCIIHASNCGATILPRHVYLSTAAPINKTDDENKPTRTNKESARRSLVWFDQSDFAFHTENLSTQKEPCMTLSFYFDWLIIFHMIIFIRSVARPDEIFHWWLRVGSLNSNKVNVTTGLVYSRNQGTKAWTCRTDCFKLPRALILQDRVSSGVILKQVLSKILLGN